MSINFLAKLLPPGDPITTWRWIIAIAVALLVLNMLSGRGALGGFMQFASAADVAEQGEKLDRVIVLQIASTLRDLRKDECSANGNKAYIQGVIEEYQQQYRELVGERYELSPCEHT